MDRQRGSLLAFPVLLAIGVILIPIVPDYAAHGTAGLAVTEQSVRWVTGHLIAAVAFVFGVLALNAVDIRLRRDGERLPTILLFSATIGAALYAVGLGLDGAGPMIDLNSGLDPTDFFDASGWWVTGVFMAATLFFGLALISAVVRINQHNLLNGLWRYAAFVASLVFVSAPAIPSGWALYQVAGTVFFIFVPRAQSDPHV